jgi:hypothetical protein
MTDREKSPDKRATGSKPATGDGAEPQHPDLGERADPDSEKSTTARPRGHTEEPGRTL